MRAPTSTAGRQAALVAQNACEGLDFTVAQPSCTLAHDADGTRASYLTATIAGRLRPEDVAWTRPATPWRGLVALVGAAQTPASPMGPAHRVGGLP